MKKLSHCFNAIEASTITVDIKTNICPTRLNFKNLGFYQKHFGEYPTSDKYRQAKNIENITKK